MQTRKFDGLAVCAAILPKDLYPLTPRCGPRRITSVRLRCEIRAAGIPRGSQSPGGGWLGGANFRVADHTARTDEMRLSNSGFQRDRRAMAIDWKAVALEVG